MKFFLVLILAFGLLVFGCAGSYDNSDGGNASGTGGNDGQVQDSEDGSETGTSIDSAGDSASNIREVHITARQWEFDPSVIEVNEGDQVVLRITSEDVEHGFAISGYELSVPLHPGEETTVSFTADTPGEFTFTCSVFCGAGHGGMAGTLRVN